MLIIVAFHDTVQTPWLYESWVKKAMFYVENQKTHVEIKAYPDDEGYFYIILRKDNQLGAKKLTVSLVSAICSVIAGNALQIRAANTCRIRSKYMPDTTDTIRIPHGR